MAEYTLSGRSSQLNRLIQVNIQDLLASFGLENLRFGRRLMEALCWLPARRFAGQMADFDRRVGDEGLHQGSRLTLERYVSRLEVVGLEHVPASGPLLVLSNHPGMTDTLALFSSLPRYDLRIVASERPFLHALTNVSRQLIYVPDDPARRMGVVRSVVSHLRRGGTALTFPAGEIEPDPACMPGAIDSLESWSESIAVFARLVPETRILVAIVSGVIWPASLVHPLTRLGKGQKESERIAASLQILAHMLRPSLRPVTVRVAFNPAMQAHDLAAGDPVALMEAVKGQARRLIASVEAEILKISETFGV
jgi:1-acyl-sn-glycerol-3-phosphate acyltransferase